MAATNAKPIPVLPAVASIIVPPGCSSPDFSAASIIANPTRSLIDPPGLCDSSLTNSSQTPVSNALILSIGVLPINDKSDVLIVIDFRYLESECHLLAATLPNLLSREEYHKTQRFIVRRKRKTL